jgi:hypothetical protein
VQRTADGSGGCHLDLHVDPAAGTVDQAADRAVALGAAVRHVSEGLVIGPDAFERECEFWATLTGWDLRAGTRPEFAYLDRPTPVPIRLLLQRRDHADPLDQVTGHVDVACASRELLAARHATSGARVVSAFRHWTTMADPTGRLYCLTGRDPQTGRLPAPAA